VDKAVTNAILQSGVQVFSAWNIIDWTVIENDDAKLVIESIMIEKEGETKTLTCDALFNFYEKTIDLNAFLGKEHRFYDARDIVRLIHFQYCIKLHLKNQNRKFDFSFDLPFQHSVELVSFSMVCW